jgi:hypothetical protein
MKLAIMQPYLFPYIGYFQLLNAVDKFIVYDDVNFIKRGWINRNRLLVDGQEYLFTVPLQKVSQNRLIKDTKHNIDEKWKNKFYSLLNHSYKKAPYFLEVIDIVQNSFNQKSPFLIDIQMKTLQLIQDFLKIETVITLNSAFHGLGNLSGQERIIDICLRESASSYINPIGGRNLYQHNLFQKNGVNLQFIASREVKYTQFDNPFLPSLSIIDVMMFNSIDAIQSFLNQCEISE